MESIDSRTSPNLDQHRKSKSILKKSDPGHQRSIDPETEKLISDSTSAASVSLNGKDAGSGSECSPNKLPLSASKSVSPPRTPALSARQQYYQVLSVGSCQCWKNRYVSVDWSWYRDLSIYHPWSKAEPKRPTYNTSRLCFAKYQFRQLQLCLDFSFW